jgi:hypothetical protein
MALIRIAGGAKRSFFDAKLNPGARGKMPIISFGVAVSSNESVAAAPPEWAI